MIPSLSFNRGTLLLQGNPPANLPSYVKKDSRVGDHRLPAYEYSSILSFFNTHCVDFKDQCKDYLASPVKNTTPALSLRDYQEEALNSWQNQNFKGITVLPTGAGKTHVGIGAILKSQLPTLIFVPTIDLMDQWGEKVHNAQLGPIGFLGGGSKTIEPVTITTYDSGSIFMENLGNRFGLLIFDECHHLPGPSYKLGAMQSIAPHRIGLSATLDDEEERSDLLNELIGPVCYQKHITDFSDQTLASYEVIRLQATLDPQEREEYEEHRQKYLSFLKKKGIFFKKKNDWNTFILLSSRNEEGKQAFASYLKQKQLARNNPRKIRILWELIQKHRQEKILVFTADNDMAYQIGRLFTLPVITHHTKTIERKKILHLFRKGELSAIVTSKVLNEGIDVPDASIGVVLSGSGSVREHVQRLGRILRPGIGKKAKLYEIISSNTSEYYISQRRRQNHAYKKSP